MGNIKFTFDTRKLERQLKNQQQEAERLAERQMSAAKLQAEMTAREARRQAEKEKRIAVAMAIVEKQPVIGGVKMMDKVSEKVLKILLELHQKEENYKLKVGYDSFPNEYHNGLMQIFENLQYYGMIFNYAPFLRGTFIINLSPTALTYFEDKEKAQKIEMEKQMQQNISIHSFTATGSNINFGTIVDSTVTAQNIVSEIERKIEEQGGEDKAELKILFDEVKELCETIKANMPLPKRANLMNRISNHLEKHGWFYGAVAQLIGNAAMAAMLGK
ncbi:MAG: hypothetical protein K2I95_09320 [Treponemataceae bacterium]|nr:hypothetical protein [Treponemataceae bacterium]